HWASHADFQAAHPGVRLLFCLENQGRKPNVVTTLVMLAYSLLMSQLKQGHAYEWAYRKLTTSTARQERLTRRLLLYQGPGGVEPADGFGHRPVEVVDEGQDLGLEVRKRGEAPAPQQLAHQDAKPDLDLVQPRAVPGRVGEADPVAGVAQEGRPARLRR